MPRAESDGRPAEATQTVRQRITALLREAELTAHEISQRARVPEREVTEHLRHLEHTLGVGGERLRMLAPHCLKCGFDFQARDRHARPGRCPGCKSERISPPRFSVVSG